MSRYVGVIVVAVLAGFGVWFFGLDIVPSIVVTLVIAGLGIVVRTIVLPSENPEWPPAPPEPSDGVRREVAELAWALRGSGGVVDDRIVWRVRRIAAEALARRHLDVENPAHRTRIEHLVGASVYSLLTSGEDFRVTLPTLQSVLRGLEALNASDPTSRT
ncbi:MAG TPA: hypothetical protein VHZ81_10650 [Galbitalea sp.]|jgi:hypothetical protein|nr:hypothetical protein [Galbitalea sp.]